MKEVQIMDESLKELLNQKEQEIQELRQRAEEKEAIDYQDLLDQRVEEIKILKEEIVEAEKGKQMAEDNE